MVRCGNRREACCPSCAHEYRGDMWQLVYAGLAGGRKGVPEQVAEHPQVFATLTSPSFGPVHNRPDDGRACRCGRRHDSDDPLLDAAIDPDTYDYEGAALWNWHAPALWNRFVIELARVLAGRAGLSERDWRTLVRVAYAKVAEFQARGLVHFHAIIRLDSADDRAATPGVAVSSEELCDAIRQAAARLAVVRLEPGLPRARPLTRAPEVDRELGVLVSSGIASLVDLASDRRARDTSPTAQAVREAEDEMRRVNAQTVWDAAGEFAALAKTLRALS